MVPSRRRAPRPRPPRARGARRLRRQGRGDAGGGQARPRLGPAGAPPQLGRARGPASTRARCSPVRAWARRWRRWPTRSCRSAPKQASTPKRDVDRVVVGAYTTSGADAVAIVCGRFDPAKITAATQSKGGTAIVHGMYAGRDTYAAGPAMYSVLTPKTVVAGTGDGVRRARANPGQEARARHAPLGRGDAVHARRAALRRHGGLHDAARRGRRDRLRAAAVADRDEGGEGHRQLRSQG